MEVLGGGGGSMSEVPLNEQAWRGGGREMGGAYRGTSLTQNCLLGPYNRTMPRALLWSSGVGSFLRARCPCKSST